MTSIIFFPVNAKITPYSLCYPMNFVTVRKLTPMSMDSETVLVTALLENIATTFKWDLDIKPDFSRDSDSRCAVSSDPARPKADVILLGGSNCQRLHTTFAEMGVSVETISSAI
jgi:hypothetical protein